MILDELSIVVPDLNQPARGTMKLDDVDELDSVELLTTQIQNWS
jgi:hypothetical protein